MTRLAWVAALVAPLVLAACGGGELTVQAALESTTGEDPFPLNGLPVRLLPYDRDAIFDSLEQAAPEPQPEIPAELVALQDSIAAAQQLWGTAEARWGAGRDSLQRLSETLQGMSRADPRYVVMFRDFNDLDAQVSALQGQMDQAFRRFEQLQAQYNSRTQEIRILREQWADEAYAGIDTVIDGRLEALGRDELADTTGATGVARFQPKRGQWWVHARYELPYTELYWNEPIEISGEEQVIRLSRENAEVRPKL